MNYKKNSKTSVDAANTMTAQVEKDAQGLNNKANDEKKEVIKPDGMIVFLPNAKAPSFVIADIIINPEALYNFITNNANLLHQNEKHGEQLKLKLLKSKDGNPYFTVNTYGLEK